MLIYIHAADAQALQGHKKHPIRIIPDPRHISPNVDEVMALLNPVDTMNEYGDGA